MPEAPAPPAAAAPVNDFDDEAPAAEEKFDPEIAKARIEKANKEAISLRKRLKELEPLARKAQEQADAEKSVEERATEKVTAADRRAEAAETKAMRLEVALEKGLPATLAARLVGSSKEELEADAAVLLASFTAAPAPEADPKRTPKERMRPGAVPSADPAGSSMNDLIRKAAGVT